ncbi:MAG: DUF4424 domain-containing protein [Firmicutes bacterium]|nr:DUF4424 domain-containing protein [Bacillota bacterium]
MGFFSGLLGRLFASPLLLFLILLLMFANAVAWADDASLGRRGEAVRLLNNDQVAMVEERVALSLEGLSRTRVDATFVFRNTGPACRVLMGFPEGVPETERKNFGDDLGLHDFKTWIDGQSIPAEREKGSPPGQDSGRAKQYPYWWTWELPFGVREAHQVRNSYWVKNHSWSNSSVLTGYVLETGASWKGSIGKVRVSLDLGRILPFQLERVTPIGYRFEDGKLVWEWTELEPGSEHNIEVIFNPRLGTFPDPSGASDQVWDIYNIYAQGLEQLDYRQILTQLEDFEKKNPSLKPADRNYLLRLQGICRFLLGGRSFAEEIWKGKNDLDSYYFLALYYHEQGELDKQQALVKEAGQVRGITPPLMLFLKQLLPPELRSSSPPQLKEFPERWPNLQIQASDPDGDLRQVTLELSYQEGGVQKTQTRVQDVHYPLPELFQLWVEPFPPPLTAVTYRFLAVDQAGHTAKTPFRVGLWLPPEMGWEGKEIPRKVSGFINFYLQRDTKRAGVSPIPQGLESDLFRDGEGFLTQAQGSLGLALPERVFVAILSSEKDFEQLSRAKAPPGVIVLRYTEKTNLVKAWRTALLDQLFLTRGSGWAQAPAWFRQGALDLVQNKNSLARDQVFFLRRQGQEKWFRFLDTAGREGFDPALEKLYGVTGRDLASRVSRQRIGFVFLGGGALVLVMLLGLPQKLRLTKGT